MPRLTAVVVGVLVAAGGVTALRAGTEPITPQRGPDAGGGRYSPPGLAAMLPGPPYDQLPGRIPIPEPTAVGRGDVLSGALPAVGVPGVSAARTSAELVLGRYCRRPGRYAVAIDQVDGWRRVRALAIRLDRSTDAPWVVLELAWTSGSYRWTGRAVQLNTC